jgi:hypothetical protein
MIKEILKYLPADACKRYLSKFNVLMEKHTLKIVGISKLPFT